jgi:hypothetical protein
VDKSLDTVESIEAFNRNDDRLKGIIWLICVSFNVPRFSIHGMFNALTYIGGVEYLCNWEL